MGFNLAGVFHMFCNQLSLIYALNPGQIVCCTPGGRQRDIQSPRGIEACYILLHSTLPFMMTHFRATLGKDSNQDVDQFSNWKIQGNFGGEDYPDKTRKIFNEGGLFGEVNKWRRSLAALRC